MIKQSVEFVRGVAHDFSEDDALSLSAAIAFYTALSFAPLVLMLASIGGMLGEARKNQLLGTFAEQLGPRAAEVTSGVIQAAQHADAAARPWWHGALSTLGLLLTASAVFGQLQASLNKMWKVEAPPAPEHPSRSLLTTWSVWVWAWLRKRLISMGMVLVVLFILLISLVLSSILGVIVPSGQVLAARIGEFAGSVIAVAGLFAAIFKFLPDLHVPWKHVWLGAFITSLLFNVGKLGLALYIDKGGVGQSYGEAIGGLIALLVWVYYSCCALLLGAEITQRMARVPPRSRASIAPRQ